jgi:electron transport complex protein RnfE
MGGGFALLLCVLGFVRELIGHASIFGRLDLLFGGEVRHGLQFTDGGFLLALLPPGAFFALGLAVAGKNAIDRRRRKAAEFRLSI